MKHAMIESSVAWLSAVEISRRVHAGDIDPQAVVRAHLATIDRLDPRILAYIHVARDARRSSGPHAGVTLAVKDSQPVAGMPYTYGTPSWRGRIAREGAGPAGRGGAGGVGGLGQ